MKTQITNWITANLELIGYVLTALTVIAGGFTVKYLSNKNSQKAKSGNSSPITQIIQNNKKD